MKLTGLLKNYPNINGKEKTDDMEILFKNIFQKNKENLYDRKLVDGK